jgi:hypothetical protein
MRWTLLAIAIAAGACGKDKGNQAPHSDAAAAPADSAMPAASAPVDTPHAMTADTAAARPAEKTTKSTTKTQPAKSASGATAPAAGSSASATSATGGVTGAQAMMGVVAAGAPRTLSKEQVKQLQAALKKQDCYEGTPDGVTGPGTQSAIECGLRKYNLTANDMSGLYKKLGLKF